MGGLRGRGVFWALSLAALLLLCGGLAQAQALLCSEPMRPRCIGWHSSFESQGDFDACRQAVARFVSETQDYLDCLKREQDRAVDEANAAVRKFNCLAQGQAYC